MERSIRELKETLDRTTSMLEQGEFLTLPPEKRHDLLKKADELAGKLADVERGFLTVGLLGGTGVGKSTLMNALAGENISSADHRRPHTDRILIYRHNEAPLPDLDLEGLPWREIVHDSRSILQVLLCDLPDFDSILFEHRDHVARFLEKLDILVWVTSPEKYADGRFYEVLAGTVKSPGNFVFVLNKADLLFKDESLEMGYDRMARLVENFRQYLTLHGVSDPLIYLLSAEEVLERDPSTWNQFPIFRRDLFRQRDMKHIRAVKAANLDVEIRTFLDPLREEARNLEVFQKILEDLQGELEKEFPRWIAAGDTVIEKQVRENFFPQILLQKQDSYLPSGPGFLVFMTLRALLPNPANGRSFSSEPVSPSLPKEIAAAFKKRLEGLEARLDRILMAEGLPSPYGRLKSDTVRASIRAEKLEEILSQEADSLTSDPPIPSFRLLWFIQWVCRLILFLFLLFAVGGNAWHQALKEPGPASIIGLLITLIQNLFSSQGLAALATYALLNLLLSIRIYTRYAVKLRRHGEELRERFKIFLRKAWGDEVRDLFEGMKDLVTEVRERKSALDSLLEKPQNPGSPQQAVEKRSERN
ncbi:MAG: 50S ribosome-binding GTPase [Deltaproteobacteria bacterium]|nr:50S ribosome-binding GTPase [Deltaproteobacteria bacterium]MBW2127749.1 50S ribosome-binding GTPase [Deltaproteobacteria bacterium]MBW2303193.1 50S ribosome-binding GTPase [Deltaproteobacteria bacterium]